MDIDIILDTRASAGQLAELGQLAEKNGIRGVWVSSLLDSRDPFTNLSTLAQSTSRLNLGPVAVNPYDTHPVRIASALLTLNELANGRARIVIGGGGEALDALGIKPQRRVRVVAECVEIIKAAASGKPVSHAGEIFQVNNLCLNWLQARTPPIYVGASMQQMLGMSARVADGIMMSDMPPTLASDAISTLDQGLEKYSRRRAEFQTNCFAAWHVYADLEQARREARQWLVLRGIFRPWLLSEFLEAKDVDLVMNSTAAFWSAFNERTHLVDGVPDSVLDTLVDNLTFTARIGDLHRTIEKLQEYASAGLSGISLRLYADPAASIRLLGKRVLPAMQ
jgi:alkanesulfonate monooxygenase SsuD/methylene tetrahydromethanopterin reductase-like flavin-dependent oxidoreductase (luciferase family)